MGQPAELKFRRYLMEISSLGICFGTGVIQQSNYRDRPTKKTGVILFGKKIIGKRELKRYKENLNGIDKFFQGFIGINVQFFPEPVAGHPDRFGPNTLHRGHFFGIKV